jgi:hypothetical protein
VLSDAAESAQEDSLRAIYVVLCRNRSWRPKPGRFSIVIIFSS